MSNAAKPNIMNRGTFIGHCDGYKRKIRPELPWLPEAGPEEEPGHSEYVKRLLAKHKFKKLVLSRNEAYEHYTPSQFIGNNI